MSKAANPLSAALMLCQILEDEYQKLGRKLPYLTNLFNNGKLKDDPLNDAPQDLFNRLRKYLSDNEEEARKADTISIFLVVRFTPEIRDQLIEDQAASKSFHEKLRDEINRIRVAELRKHLGDANQDKLAALCFSGGGIRSATFGLGIIQGLARCGLLNKFDYLSTVSGGGYIGSWLSAWIHREGFDEVEEALKKDPETLFSSQEPSPLTHLREYSNYLTPQLGLLTADTWAVAATFLRNLLLNWMVLIPLIMLGLAVPRLVLALIKWNPGYYTINSVQIYWRDIALALSFISGVYGLIGFSIFRPSEQANLKKPSKKKDDTQGRVLLHSLLPLLISGFFMMVFWAWLHLEVKTLPQPAIEDFSQQARAFFTQARRLLPSLGWFACFTLAMTLLAFCLSFIKLKFSDFKMIIGKFAVVIVGGSLAGALAYPLAINVFPNPFGTYSSQYATLLYVCFAFPLVMIAFFLATVFFAALQSKTEKILDDEDREWLARLGGWVLIVVGVWIFLSVIALFGPWGIYKTNNVINEKIAAVGGISGVITWFLGKSPLTAATSQKEKGGSWQNLVLAIAAPIFVVFFLTILSLLTSELIELIWQATTAEAVQKLNFDTMLNVGSVSGAPGFQWHLEILNRTSPMVLLVLFAGLALVGLVMGYFVNVNKFSMHAMYRNRLIRAYLGASRKRSPNPFTGFDSEDNFPMHELRTYEYQVYLFQVKNFSEQGTKMVQRLKGSLQPTGIDLLTDSAAEYLLNEVLKLDGGKPEIQRVKSLLTDYVTPNKPADDLVKPIATALNMILENKDIDITPEGIFRPAETPAALEGINFIVKKRKILDEVFKDELEKFTHQKPFHVINMALNLVKGENLAWQERKAESFTVSPLHSGCLNNKVGYRYSTEYGNKHGKKGISIGTAMAISGAAVSPNMGYHSSSVITFLLTLFNARLGWWLGNPNGKNGDVWPQFMKKFMRKEKADEKTYQRGYPSFAVRPIFAEAFGLTNDKNPYIYLSDGGHFENLGLYEMVVRRCRFIVVSDAGQDDKFTFDDFGNAIRKIRIDLGIPIVIEKGLSLFPCSDDDAKNQEGKYCAIAKIKYSEIDGTSAEDDGTLIYFKPAYYRQDEPTDVFNYAKAHASFPHETTVGDQCFSESQFESYRMLGLHAVEQICEDNGVVGAGLDPANPNPSLEDLKKAVNNYLR